ncbi:MAG: hypothetical protein EO766_11635 [Hydrotalea sp. AMD]|uniref:hypothetical protein n=1 Tax=Hydrotalea sp. AMD TaxID=2501297 RepID=UPI0010250823|nr:hypothetical protein [Hydrotalea sp. AMD]RWZ87183.1 MAG: hypothetical protein EO766_11635 [Hydrotalea sp. AMD]
MRKLVLTGLVLCSTVVLCEDIAHAAGGHRGHHAVKRLDTTPTDTEDDSWILGLESNTYADTVYLNPTVAYSGANNWDISISSYNIPVYGGGAQNYEYDTYAAISKTFDITKDISLVFGTQNGTTLFPDSMQRWHNMDFSNGRYKLTNWLTVSGGVYFANKSLTTVANEVGFMSGFEMKLIPGTLHLQGDYMSGHTNVSGAEINLQWYATRQAQLYIGVIVPERDSGNEFAGVLGFNISTKDMLK